MAIALLRAGAGPEAVVALTTAWSLIAVNRTLLFELPMLGPRFTAWRLALCIPLPIITGVLAGLLIANSPWRSLAAQIGNRPSKRDWYELKAIPIRTVVQAICTFLTFVHDSCTN